jgi:hypothetical protein
MPATHIQFTRQMRRRLKSTAMGLGLIRLLQDARRFEEARATLLALELGLDDAGKDSDPWCRDSAARQRLDVPTGHLLAVTTEDWDQHLVCI